MRWYQLPSRFHERHDKKSSLLLEEIFRKTGPFSIAMFVWGSVKLAKRVDQNVGILGYYVKKKLSWTSSSYFGYPFNSCFLQIWLFQKKNIHVLLLNPHFSLVYICSTLENPSSAWNLCHFLITTTFLASRSGQQLHLIAWIFLVEQKSMEGRNGKWPEFKWSLWNHEKFIYHGNP